MKHTPPQTEFGWIAYLATGLELILGARSLKEVRRIARERMGEISDPAEGIKQVPYDLQKRWYVAANKKEDERDRRDD